MPLLAGPKDVPTTFGGGREKKERKKEKPKRIISKVELSNTENSCSSSSLPSFPSSFPSPSLSVSRLKKGFTDVKKY